MTSIHIDSNMPAPQTSTEKADEKSANNISKPTTNHLDDDLPATQITPSIKAELGDKVEGDKNGKTSIKQENSAEGTDDEFIDIRPNIRIKKSNLTSEQIESLIVKCTACRKQINHHDSHRVKRHPHLGVLICKECLDFYDTGEFSQDDDGDKYCRWCAQGGTLYSCDFCSNVFCNECVRYNFGRGEARKIQEQNWKCYVCEPGILEGKVKFCDLLYEFSKGRALKKKSNKTFKPNQVIVDSGDFDSPMKFLPKFFDKSTQIADEFKDHISKLSKRLHSSSKTPKHILKTFEEYIINLRFSTKELVIEANQAYNKYIEGKISKATSDNCSLDVTLDDNGIEPTQIYNGEKAKDSIPDAINDLVDDVVANTEKLSDNDLDQTVAMDQLCATQLVNSESMHRAGDRTKTEDASFFVKENFVFSSSDEKSGSKKKSKTRRRTRSAEKGSNGKTSTAEKVVITLTSSESEHSDATVKRSDVENEMKDSKADVKKIVESESFKPSRTSSTETTEQLTELPLSSDKKKKKVSKVEQTKSSSSASSSSRESFSLEELTDDGATVPKSRRKRKKRSLFTKSEIAKWNADKEMKLKDVKLNSTAAVVVDRLDISPERIKAALRDIEDSRKVEKNSLKSMERSVKKLLEEPVKRKRSLGDSDDTPRPACKKNLKGGTKKKAEKARDSSSDVVSLASLSDSSVKDVPTVTPASSVTITKKENKVFTKVFHNSESDEDESSGRDMDAMGEKKSQSKNTKKKAAAKSESSDSDQSAASNKSSTKDDDSDDDFIVTRKMSKKDEKLIKKANSAINKDCEKDDNKGEKDKSKGKDKKKSKKRKIIYSDESGTTGESDHSDSASDSMSDFENNKKKKGKNNKRKRIKIDNSSDEDEAKKTDDDQANSQATPGKGRKNIRKVISEKSLDQETIDAQKDEKERRKRLQDRQKLYNRITDTAEDGKETITRKMVLEIDPDSKEEVVQIHPDIVEKLKPHQINGVKFMWEATIESLKLLETKPGSGCILAHCMGLGKTLQVIAFLYTLFTNKYTKKKLRTAMIVCPNNTVMNWAKEFDYWLDDGTDTINVFEMVMIKDYYSRLELLKNWQKDGGVLILGYDIFSRLVEGKIPKKNKDFKQKIFSKIADPGADIVVCDEGHKLKNEKSLLSRCANKLRTLRRIVLTGTPLQNNLKEYYCMMNFVKPRLLGTFKEFTNRFVNPIVNGQYDDSSKHDVKLMKKRVHILHKLLEGCVQRCDYSALTHFLPPKHEFVISVQLSDMQVKLYQTYLDLNSRIGSNDDGEQKVDGRKLFPDYSILKNVWTFPYALQLNYERLERQKILKGEDVDDDGNLQDFIDDESATDTPNSSDDDDLKCLNDPQPGPSRRRTRNTKPSDSSGDEVIKKYPRPEAEAIGSDDDVSLFERKQWFHKFLGKDDKFKTELGGKIVLTLEILRECESIGDKILIFSTSLITLDLIEMFLKYINDQPITKESVADESRDISHTWVPELDYFRMDGKCPVEIREKYMEKFNNKENPRARLMLISTKAGSLGTNLVGANRVILLDASWNPSDDVQSIFRVYRFGQVKPVYIYRFLAQGTMEEKIYNRQVTKLSMSCRVVDEQNIDRHFNAAQLSELYTFEPDTREDRPTLMVPKDRLLADLIMNHKQWIVNYFEHDSLLQHTTEDDLTEEERQAAWTEYENEKEGIYNNVGNANAGVGGYIQNPINIQSIIRTISENAAQKNPKITPYELKTYVISQLSKLRTHLQMEHTNLLRQKQESVSMGIPVSQELQTSLEHIQTAMQQSELYMTQMRRAMNADYIKQQAQFNNAQAYQNIRLRGANFQAAFQNMGQRTVFMGPNAAQFQTMGPRAYRYTYARAPTPGKGPTIVDITGEEKEGEKETQGDDPIVTFSEEPAEPKKTSATHNVKITEVE